MTPFLRIYELSIINYLKYEILPVSFTETLQNQNLTFDSVTNSYVLDSLMVPSPISKGRGWALFDEQTVNGKIVIDTSQEQSNQVTVNGASSYTLDYVNGRIINPDSTPTSVSFSWYYVSFVEGWPGEIPPPLPVVALDIDTVEKQGYQLGGGSKDLLTGSVYVFATNEAEKRDITDVLYQALYNRTLSIKNWHQGSYLDFNGTYTGFTPDTVSGVSTGAFLDVIANMSVPKIDWSELNRHRSRINFTFEVYKDD